MACATPQKHFSKGNYQKAFNTSLKELEKKNDRKLKQILNRSFGKLLEEKTYSINNLSASRKLQDWEKAFALYEDLVADFDEADRFLDSEYDTIMNRLIDDRELLALSIADNYEEMAFNSMEDFERRNNKVDAQEAYKYFNKLAYYQPDYPELSALIDEAYDAGLIHMLIDVNTWDYKYQWDIDQQFRQIENESRNFVRLHYNRIVPEVDCEVDVNFDNLRIQESRAQSKTESFTKLIQDGFETVTDANGNTTQKPKYIQIEGFLTTYTNSRRYEWHVNLMADRFSKYCDLNPRTFVSSQTVSRNEYQTSGDLRAIPDQYKLNSNQNDYDLSENRIVDELIRDLYNQIVNHLNIR
jgi:hypothetical protein